MIKKTSIHPLQTLQKSYFIDKEHIWYNKLVYASQINITYDEQEIHCIYRSVEDNTSMLMTYISYELYILSANDMACLKNHVIDYQGYDWEQLGRDFITPPDRYKNTDSNLIVLRDMDGLRLLQKYIPFFTFLKEIPICKKNEIKSEKKSGFHFVGIHDFYINNNHPWYHKFSHIGAEYACLTRDGQKVLCSVCRLSGVMYYDPGYLTYDMYSDLRILDIHSLTCLKNFGRIESIYSDGVTPHNRGVRTEHEARIRFCESIDGNLIAYYSEIYGHLKLISLETNSVTYSFSFKESVNDMFFLPGGKYILVWVNTHRMDSGERVDTPHSIKILNVENGEIICDFICQLNDIISIAINDNNGQLAIRTYDRVYVYQINIKHED